MDDSQQGLNVPACRTAGVVPKNVALLALPDLTWIIHCRATGDRREAGQAGSQDDVP